MNDSNNLVQARINPDGSVNEDLDSNREFVIKPKISDTGRVIEEDTEASTNNNSTEMLNEIVIEEKPTSSVVVQSRINPDGSVNEDIASQREFVIKPKVSDTGRIIEEDTEASTNNNSTEMLNEIVIEEKTTSSVVVQSRINPDGSVSDDSGSKSDFVIHSVVGSSGRVGTSNDEENNE